MRNRKNKKLIEVSGLIALTMSDVFVRHLQKGYKIYRLKIVKRIFYDKYHLSANYFINNYITYKYIINYL